MPCILFSLISFLCFVHLVLCQYVSLQAPTQPVVCQHEKIQFTCIPLNVRETDHISVIILQKNSTIGWQDVVEVYTDNSTGQLQRKVTWTSISMLNRASIITAITTPSISAGLKIEISADNVVCSDDGNYRCSIAGYRDSGGRLDSQSTHVHVTLLVTESSNTYSQTNNLSLPGAVVGGLLGGITAIIDIVLIIIVMRKQGLQVYRRKEGLKRRPTPTALGGSVSSKESNENEITTISEIGQNVHERSYESLGAKSIPNVYEQLTNESEMNPAYQTLGEQEKPNVYEQLTKENEINSTYQTMGEKDKPNVYDYLSNQPELDNDPYVNINI